MVRPQQSIWLTLSCLGLLAPLVKADDLASRIAAVIDGPDYKQARWGILVVDAQTGQTVYERDPDRLFLPASTTKLYSCAAALIALGPDYRFETPVYRRGPVIKGRLLGDLILVASGDLTLGGRTGADGKMAFKDHDHTYANTPLGRAEVTDTDPLAGLKALARQVKAAGIDRVEGDVLVDDHLFARALGSGSGPGLLTPIIVNDNVIDVLITPGAKEGELAGVRMRPETGFVQMDAQVTTVAEGRPVRLDLEVVGLQRFVVRGQIPLQSPPYVRIYPVDDPAAFARALFIETLRREGVIVTASPLQPPRAELPEKDRYNSLERVACFTSPPLSEAIKVTLKVSHNLYASTLPLLVAVKNGKRTLPEGLRLQGKVLAELGVPVETISFAGGAGGANADCVTPRATVQLLQAMARRPEYAVYRAALPVLGVDGTLAEAVAADSPARGKVRAKTGTLFWQDLMNDRPLLRSKALAGTLTTAGGRELLFAMFVNDVPLPKNASPTREGKVLGRLCEILHQHAPAR
ncbi:MAG TPA: D-alanyl-D-alanine carboxypeptidase/D-alanyl-D-alanine-endopeptidase [Gemmataceae bacterium]|nr:D-alanyl-D-alanine carboxypeptidase/D-alanyl-D-alanine-endopeptidase [Gemmataceae bacterium]